MFTYLEIVQSLLFLIPFIMAGFVHLAVMRNGMLSGLQKLPLDCGIKVRGRRLFGANKTVRGLITVVVAVTLWTSVETFVLRWISQDVKLSLIARNGISPIIAGLLLGTSWVLAELPNSFIKRQLGIAPGARSSGYRRFIFGALDQADSIIGVLLCAFILLRLSAYHILLISAFGLTLHPIGDLVMMGFGLKVHYTATVSE